MDGGILRGHPVVTPFTCITLHHLSAAFPAESRLQCLITANVIVITVRLRKAMHANTRRFCDAKTRESPMCPMVHGDTRVTPQSTFNWMTCRAFRRRLCISQLAQLKYQKSCKHQRENHDLDKNQLAYVVEMLPLGAFITSAFTPHEA